MPCPCHGPMPSCPSAWALRWGSAPWERGALPLSPHPEQCRGSGHAQCVAHGGAYCAPHTLGRAWGLWGAPELAAPRGERGWCSGDRQLGDPQCLPCPGGWEPSSGSPGSVPLSVPLSQGTASQGPAPPPALAAERWVSSSVKGFRAWFWFFFQEQSANLLWRHPHLGTSTMSQVPLGDGAPFWDTPTGVPHLRLPAATWGAPTPP